MNLSMEICTRKQLEELTTMSKKTFIEAFENLNNPEDFEAYLHKAFNREQIAAELDNKNSFFFLVKESGNSIGYFKLNVLEAQSDIGDPEAAELERIYVYSKYQGKGIGYQMLQEAIQVARSLEKKYLWLGVWQENKDAIRFYEKHGFKIFGEHPYYIGKDRQMDWLMRLDL